MNEPERLEEQRPILQAREGGMTADGIADETLEGDEAYWVAFPGRVKARIVRAQASGAPRKEAEMFNDTFFEASHDFKLKAFVFPLSVAAHAVLVLFLIIAPLLKMGELPEVQIYSAFLAPPTPPPPPPPPPAKKRTASNSRTRIKPVQAQSMIAPGRLVAPVEIPREIVDEQVADIGIEGGVEDGIEGGIAGGILGGVVGGAFGGILGPVETPVRTGGEIRPPKLLKEVPPIYPMIAQASRKEGVVIIEAVTDIYGRVIKWKVLRSEPLLDQAAIDAVKQWVYEPMIINGRPRGVIFTVTVRFELK